MKKTIISILTLSIVSITILSINNSNNNSVSALTYSDNVGINFTFSPSLSVSLSSASGSGNADLVINDLTPGSSSDSNIVDINVVTNNINGYYLTSTVGNNVDIDSNDTGSGNSNLIHNTTNLVHSNGTNAFTSLATSDSIADTASFDSNTWGYSYSIDNQSTWSAYSGLPLYNDTTHITTLSNKYAPSNDTINFKIGAKSSVSQASGEYTNTINFITTAYPSPMSLADSYAYFNKPQIDGYYTMQDMEPGICALAEEESELQVMDVRDNNIYTIAKLKDDRCWMTTNLDLPGGTALYSETSNVPDGYPESAGIPYYTLPGSSTEGFNDNTKAFVYNSGNHTENCTSSQPCYSYYSWIAATAGSGDTVAPYSICPSSWYLPNSYTDLLVAYGMPALLNRLNDGTVPTGSYVYNNINNDTIVNVALAGHYVRGVYEWGGSGTHYWTSVSYNDASISKTTITKNNNDPKMYGFSVRCLANQ